MTKVLLIDDNPNRLPSLKPALENNGHQVFVSDSGYSGVKIAWQESPDLVILNLHLPTMDGFEMCRRLRELGVPYVLVTDHRRNDKSAVKALEMGADDYISYPIETPVLLVKIRTLMRRNNRHAKGKASVFDDGHLLVDLDTRRVEISGEPVKLTPTEFRLLSVLLRNMGRVITHEDLIREIWGTDKDASLGSLKLYIHYLRNKIETHPKKPYYLLAEWGIGYRFREPERIAQMV